VHPEPNVEKTATIQAPSRAAAQVGPTPPSPPHRRRVSAWADSHEQHTALIHGTRMAHGCYRQMHPTAASEGLAPARGGWQQMTGRAGAMLCTCSSLLGKAEHCTAVHVCNNRRSFRSYLLSGRSPGLTTLLFTTIVRRPTTSLWRHPRSTGRRSPAAGLPACTLQAESTHITHIIHCWACSRLLLLLLLHGTHAQHEHERSETRFFWGFLRKHAKARLSNQGRVREARPTASSAFGTLAGAQ
jgi:hypothetical protein